MIVREKINIETDDIKERISEMSEEVNFEGKTFFTKHALASRSGYIAEACRVEYPKAGSTVRFVDRKTHRKMAELTFLPFKSGSNRNFCPIEVVAYDYDEEGLVSTKKKRYENPYKSTFYLAYLTAVRGDRGIPISGYLHFGNRSCKARLYIKHETNEYNGVEISFYWYCKTKDTDGKWKWTNHRIDAFKKRKLRQNKELAISLFECGVHVDAIAKMLGKCRRTIESYVKDVKEVKRIQCNVRRLNYKKNR